MTAERGFANALSIAPLCKNWCVICFLGQCIRNLRVSFMEKLLPILAMASLTTTANPAGYS